MHEAHMHKQNSFITLTYSPEFLPKDYSVHIDHLQKFFKRLRKNTNQRFKYFACGEYGDINKRPHYHAILFGMGFADRTLWSKTNTGDLLYRSNTLEKSWQLGHSSIGEVTFQSCAYVARYVMKKRKGKPDHVDTKTGKSNEEHYKVVDPDTGEIHQIQPEFCLASRGSGKKTDPTIWRYGIGRAWIEKYQKDTNKDYVTHAGNKFPLPKYYDSYLENQDKEAMLDRKAKRLKSLNKEEKTLERLQQISKVTDAKLNQLPRKI